MIELKDLLADDEVVVNFYLHNEYCSRNCIARVDSDDISGALEDTLHRIIDAGGTEKDVCRIMGARIPTDEELAELKKFGEYVPIDLGYVLFGLVDMWDDVVA